MSRAEQTPQASTFRTAPGWSRDLTATLAGLAALVLWDASGADQVVTAWFGNRQGFAWRHHFLTSTLVHDGGRALAWAALLGLLVGLLLDGRRQPALAGGAAVAVPVAAAAADLGKARSPRRAERWYWFAVTLGCLLLVPAIKRYSATSCPWDMDTFGGSAHAVSHWLWGVPDGGPGHCFPSGHAVGAFAFFSQYFLWRPHRPRRARALLVLVLAAGCIFGLGQLARGAHHVSHSAWSAWLCWTACALASAWRSRRALSGP